MENEILRTTMGRKGVPLNMPSQGTLAPQRPGLWDFIRGFMPRDPKLPIQTPTMPVASIGIRG